MTERVFYEVATLQPPSAPFAVVAIYPDRREGSGCSCIVQSLHYDEVDADAALAALSQSTAGEDGA